MKKFLLEGISMKGNSVSAVVLLMRLLVGGAMLTHGIPKLLNFELLSTQFPGLLGMGSKLSLILAIGGEVGCSILLIFGLFTRLASLGLVGVMAGAVFIAHGSDPFAARELAVLYMGINVSFFFLGGGNYSVDSLIFNKNKWQEESMLLPNTNMGCTDRIIRMVAAATAFTLYFAGILNGVLAAILLIMSVSLIITSITGFCILYTFFGWDTRCKTCGRA